MCDYVLGHRGLSKFIYDSSKFTKIYRHFLTSFFSISCKRSLVYIKFYFWHKNEKKKKKLKTKTCSKLSIVYNWICVTLVGGGGTAKFRCTSPISGVVIKDSLYNGVKLNLYLCHILWTETLFSLKLYVYKYIMSLPFLMSSVCWINTEHLLLKMYERMTFTYQFSEFF